MVFSMAGISGPNFYLGLILIIVFGVDLGWLPTGGYTAFSDDPAGWFACMTLPAISLALLLTGLLVRITRSTMLEVLGRTMWHREGEGIAAAAGSDQARAVELTDPDRDRHRHHHQPAPVRGRRDADTVLDSRHRAVATQAVLNRYYPMVQGGVLVVTALMVLVNIAVDLLYAVLDPRVLYDAA